MTTILIVLGAVALGAVVWVAWHVRREVLRRDQASRVRVALAHRVPVAELVERCPNGSSQCCPPSRAA